MKWQKNMKVIKIVKRESEIVNDIVYFLKFQTK